VSAIGLDIVFPFGKMSTKPDQVHLPALATYLGHARPQDTYWYLTAAPQVLEAAAVRFEAFAALGRVTP
jgi:hypothetical protein